MPSHEEQIGAHREDRDKMADVVKRAEEQLSSRSMTVGGAGRSISLVNARHFTFSVDAVRSMVTIQNYARPG